MRHAERAEAYAVAYLHVISKELTPAMISEHLGLEATSTQQKGEVQECDEYHWRFTTHRFTLQARHGGERESFDSAAKLLQRAIEELLTMIEPVADKLNALRPAATTELVCVYGSSAGVEAFKVPENLLRRIATLQLALTVYPVRMEPGQTMPTPPDSPPTTP